MSEHKRCPIPFTQLYLHSTGDIYPCSFAQNYPLGNVKDQDLLAIWQGEPMQRFRADHLQGKQTQCSRSQKDHACHLHHDHLNATAVFQKNIETPPIRLDFMVDSFCNLKCVMCTNVLEDNGGYDHEEFWNHCRDHIFPHLKEMEIIGGEPFILENTYKLVELINERNPDCLFRVTTNAHYQFNDRFKNLVDKMNFESLAVSVDSLKEDVFARIREGAKLGLVLQTLDDWISYAKEREQERPIKIVVNFVIQKDNAYELPSFIDFCEKKEVLAYPILLRDPENFAIFDWSTQEVEKLLDFYLDAQIARPHPALSLVCHKIFKSLSKDIQLDHFEKYKKAMEVK